MNSKISELRVEVFDLESNLKALLEQNKCKSIIKDIRQEVDELITQKGFLGKIMKKSAVFSRVASVGIRLFGTAVVNAIPVIGQIIMVLGFVITGLKALWSAISKPSEAMKQMGAQPPPPA